MSASESRILGALAEARAGEALPDHREMLDLLLADTNTGFALLDKDFRIVGTNETYARARDRAATYFNGRKHCDVYAADVLRVFERVRESGKPATIESQALIAPDHAERHATYWDCTLIPVLDAAGGLNALIVAEAEVTERMRLEKSLYRNSRILAAIDQALELHDPGDEPQALLDSLLAEVINLTESEYGFIGEVTGNAGEEPSLKLQTTLNFTRYGQALTCAVASTPQYLSLSDPDTPIGRMMHSSEALIANDRESAPQIDDLDDPHPPFRSFLGIPFRIGQNLQGAIAVANSPDGYDKSLVAALQPLLKCHLQLIASNASYRAQNEALATIEESDRIIRDLAIPAVETEHDALIDLINECYEELAGDADVARTNQILEQIYSAVSSHFSNEERLMRQSGYPEYEEHRENHSRLLATLRRNMDRMNEDPDYGVLLQQKTLANWFARHVATHDSRLNRYLSA